MRDVAVTLIVFGLLPLVLARPWIGILLWSWLGYMNPHRLSWGFAFDFPFAQAAAAATLAGMALTRDWRPFVWCGTTVVWLLFVAWMTITTIFAVDQTENWTTWQAVMKVQLFAFLTILLIQGRERIIPLIWVIVLSLGFYGFKGGLFVFRTGGENLVWGPAGSFISDNNALALSLIMTLPLMWFLYQEHTSRPLRILLGSMMVLASASVLGSHSRGAALAGGIMVFVLWLKSRHKLKLGLAMLAVLPFLLLSMPDKYFERVETIKTFEEDGSAQGRLRAWRLAIEIALDRPVVGAGFNSIVEENYRRFAPAIVEEIEKLPYPWYPEAHSIYFKILGDHGFVGLALFLLLGLGAYRTAGFVIRKARDGPQLGWAGNLASMIQVSLVGFAVGGAFLGLCYFDFYYALIAVSVVLRQAVTAEAALNGEAPAAATATADPLARAPVPAPAGGVHAPGDS